MKDLDKIKKEMQAKGTKVVCVKHSHNTLIDNGVVPWACTILDPRPFNENPHGYVRKELLSNPHKDVMYCSNNV